MTETLGAPVTPADAIAADGVTIRLADDTTPVLRYSMGSLRLLEQRFGSLQGMRAELMRGQYGRPCPAHAELTGERDPNGDLKRSPGKGAAVEDCLECQQPAGLFTALSDAIAPALLHVTVTHPDSGQRVRLGKDAELLAELLHPMRLPEYMTAWATAFGQAMAIVSPGNAAAGGPVAASPGPSGTTPPPSYSDAQNVSSG